MEELTVQRMIVAAHAQEGDPGWSARVIPDGIQLTYAWRSENGKFYVVENLTSWTAIALAKVNPLLFAMSDLLKQKDKSDL